MAEAAAPFSYSYAGDAKPDLRGLGASRAGAVTVSIFADRERVRDQLLQNAMAAGLGVRRCETLEPLSGEEPAPLADIVLVDVPSANAAMLSALADLDMRAARGGNELVVSTSIAGLDAVFGCLDQSGAQLLVTPADGERALALGEALARLPGGALQELAAEDRVALLRLTEQVGMLARRVEGLAGSEVAGLAPEGDFIALKSRAERAAGDGAAGGAAEQRKTPPAALVREIIRQRQLRAKFFDGELFADPAWDMLLDLTAAQAENAQVSVSSLCIAANVPPTTALRWIAQMTDAGLLLRIQDKADRRRAFMALSEKAADAMSDYFTRLGPHAAVV